MKKRNLLSTVLVCLICAASIAQAPLAKNVKYSNSGTVSFAQFELNNHYPDSTAINFLKTFLTASSNDGFELKKTETDNYGIHHQRFQQTFQNKEVYGGEYLVHSQNGDIISINGSFIPISNNINMQVNITEAEALANALTQIDAETYRWQVPYYEKIIKNIKKDDNATYYPKGNLVLASKTLTGISTKLAWQFKIATASPIGNWLVFVDALSGAILKEIDITCTINKSINTTSNQYKPKNTCKKSVQQNKRKLFIQGSAKTRYSEIQNINVDFDNVNNEYILRKTDIVSGNRIIETHVIDEALRTISNNPPVGTTPTTTIQYEFECKNSSNVWDDQWADLPTFQSALDVHWANETILNFFSDKFNRNSYDNNGGMIHNTVFINKNFANAMADGGGNFTYGDGNYYMRPLVSLDICSHELGHSLNEFTSQLGAYGLENDGIAEGFADILGVLVDNYYNKFIKSSGGKEKNVWEIGEDVIKASPRYLRSFKTPKFAYDANIPDCYGSSLWYKTLPKNDPHQMSGVFAKWFYILCEGETGTNDLGDDYSVQGIGINDAQKVIYAAQQYYINSSIDYKQLREATLLALSNVFPSDVAKEKAMTNAWYAVGIGLPYNSTINNTCLPTGFTSILPNDVNSNANFSNGVYYLPSDINIPDGVVVTFTNAIVIAAPTAKIFVSGGGELNILGSHFSTCVGRWGGISASFGSKVDIKGNSNGKPSLIEDADIVLSYDFQNNTYFGSSSLNYVNIDNVIFNRNKLNLSIGNTKLDVNNITTDTYIPVIIKKALFTSRNIATNIAASWDDINTIITPPSGGSITFPHIESYTAPYIDGSKYSLNFLKKHYSSSIAFSNDLPEAGLLELGIGCRMVYTLYNYKPYAYLGLKIGDDGTNATDNTVFFDNMLTGIYANDANVDVNNSIFQTDDAYKELTTKGIIAESTQFNFVDIKTSNSSPNNAFYNLNTAIECNGGKKININNCFIASNQDYNYANNNTILKGSNGIIVNNQNFDKVSINSNILANIRYGIHTRTMDYCKAPFIPSGNPKIGEIINVKVGDIIVNNNNIKKQISSVTSTGKEYVSNGIISETILLGIEHLECNNNIITDAANGILMSGWRYGNLGIYNNTIQLANDPI